VAGADSSKPRLAAEARATLGHAKAILALKMPDPKEGRPYGGDFHDWLHTQILVQRRPRSRSARTTWAQESRIKLGQRPLFTG
jgi:hypothetical protein